MAEPTVGEIIERLEADLAREREARERTEEEVARLREINDFALWDTNQRLAERDQALARAERAEANHREAVRLMREELRPYPEALGQARADLADAVEALRKLEWAAWWPRPSCPACAVWNRYGDKRHADDCWLRALLDRLEGK